MKPADAALPTATLRAGWRERADGIVDVEQMLTNVFGDPSPPAVSRPTVDEVLEAVETKHAQWAEAQLLEEIAARVTGPDPATIAEVIEAVRAEAMGSFGVVDLTPPAEDGDRLRASDGRPVHVPPSAVRYTTRRHLEREVAIVEWATSADTGQHRAVNVDDELLDGLDDGQVAAVVAMLSDPRPVITVVGPAGAGKTTMLAAAVTSWRRAGSACSVSVRQRPQHGNSETVPGRWRTRCTSSSTNTASTDRRTWTRRRDAGSTPTVGGDHRRERDGRHPPPPRIRPNRAGEAVAHGAGG